MRTPLQLLRGCLLLLVLAGAACDSPDPLSSELAVTFRRADAPSLTNLIVVAYNRIDVYWQDNSPNETGFEVHRGPTATGTFALVTRTGAGATAYGDFGIDAVTQYCYKVRAFRTTGKNTTVSDFSNTACGTTPAVPVPNAPSGVNAAPFSSNGITVTWVDNSTDETGFKVEFSLNGGASWQTGWNIGANQTAQSDYGRLPEQAVCYRVIAVNNFGDSPVSNVDCTAPPLGPDQFTASGVAGPAIDLTWTDRSGVEDGYEVRRAGPSGWATIAVLPVNAHSYHDASAPPDVRHTYSVAARKDGGYSDFTYATGMTVSGPPTAPTSVDAIPRGSAAIGVYWSGESANVETFRIERSSDNGASWSSAGTAVWGEAAFLDYAGTGEQRQCYRVVAINNAGESAPSMVDCATPPTGPTNLSATPVEGGAIDLTWDDNSGVEEAYEVRQYVNDCGYYYYCYPYYATVAQLPAGTTSFRLSGFYPNTFYIFVVVALKDGGESDWSNEVGSYPGPYVP
jgi:hypothetical protein